MRAAASSWRLRTPSLSKTARRCSWMVYWLMATSPAICWWSIPAAPARPPGPGRWSRRGRPGTGTLVRRARVPRGSGRWTAGCRRAAVRRGRTASPRGRCAAARRAAGAPAWPAAASRGSGSWHELGQSLSGICASQRSAASFRSDLAGQGGQRGAQRFGLRAKAANPELAALVGHRRWRGCGGALNGCPRTRRAMRNIAITIRLLRR